MPYVGLPIPFCWSFSKFRLQYVYKNSMSPLSRFLLRSLSWDHSKSSFARNFQFLTPLLPRSSMFFLRVTPSTYVRFSESSVNIDFTPLPLFVLVRFVRTPLPSSTTNVIFANHFDQEQTNIKYKANKTSEKDTQEKERTKLD